MPRTKKASAASSLRKSRGAARARAAESNPRTRRPSTHGGARAGAGRKAAKLPDEVIARLGKPGDTPRELRTWTAKLLAEVQLLAIRGEIGSDLAATIRANAGAIDRVLPVDRAAPADDDEDDEEGDGPELEEASEDDGLRVG